MTIGSKDNSTIETKQDVSSAYIDALLRQLPDEQKASLLQKHAEQTLPVVIEDKSENKLANINFQEYGLNRAEFDFVCENFVDSLPYLEHDPNNLEDVKKVDTNVDDGTGGDDPYDAARYGIFTPMVGSMASGRN